MPCRSACSSDTWPMWICNRISPTVPSLAPKRGKRVAIIGAGPAGLSAAYYLQQDGFDCTVFDEHDEPGGMLRYAVTERNLPRDVLNTEIAQIQKLGVTFKLRTRVGIAILLDEIREQFGAVFLATGELKAGDADALGIEASSDGVKIDPRTGRHEHPRGLCGRRCGAKTSIDRACGRRRKGSRRVDPAVPGRRAGRRSRQVVQQPNGQARRGGDGDVPAVRQL